MTNMSAEDLIREYNTIYRPQYEYTYTTNKKSANKYILGAISCLSLLLLVKVIKKIR